MVFLFQGGRMDGIICSLLCRLGRGKFYLNGEYSSQLNFKRKESPMKTNHRITQMAVAVAGALAVSAQPAAEAALPQTNSSLAFADNPAAVRDKINGVSKASVTSGTDANYMAQQLDDVTGKPLVKSADDASTKKQYGLSTYTGYHVQFAADGKPIVTLHSRHENVQAALLAASQTTAKASARANLQPAGTFMSIGGGRGDLGSSAASAAI